MKQLSRNFVAVCAGLASLLWSGGALATPTTGLVISEILFDPTGSNNQRQWVELYNRTGASVDLSTFSLGWGRADYTQGVFQLSGTLADGETWVIGGPISDGRNGNPTLDVATDIAPNLRIGNGPGRTDGVALFDVVATSITPTLAPIHAVIYGRSGAGTVLIDETGAVGTSLFTTNGFAAGSSIELDGFNGWQLQTSPTAGSVPPSVPQPGTAVLMALGLMMMRGPWARSSGVALH